MKRGLKIDSEKTFYFLITATLISLITFISVLSILELKQKGLIVSFLKKSMIAIKICLILNNKFKLDINEISLFLETTDPQIEILQTPYLANSIKV